MVAHVCHSITRGADRRISGLSSAWLPNEFQVPLGYTMRSCLKKKEITRLLPRTISGSVVLLQPGFVQKSEAPVTTKGHVEAQGWG